MAQSSNALVERWTIDFRIAGSYDWLGNSRARLDHSVIFSADGSFVGVVLGQAN